MMSAVTLHRFRAVVLAGLCLAVSASASAQGLGTPVKNMLGKASDKALTKLSQPGAFMADEAIRIVLPGPLKQASALMKLTDQAGLIKGLTKSLNDAAGAAAGEAKPIFRNAINRMTLKDGVGIISKGDGATRYLKSSAGADLQTKIRPLIASALGKSGAFAQLSKLGKTSSLLSGTGFSRDGLTDSVTDQAMDGIFKYIGNEEEKLRANPIGAATKMLEGIH